MKITKLLKGLALGGALSLISSSAMAFVWLENPWLIRVRGLYVQPHESSSTISGIGGHVDDISNEFAPEIDATYFFTRYIALEAGIFTSRHRLEARGTTVDSGGKTRLGKVSLLSPSLMLQLHLQDAIPSRYLIDPYFGLGLNYTYFYDVDEGADISSISYRRSFGLALQAGIDIYFTENWLINADIKKLYMQSDADINAAGTPAKTTIKFNPMVYGLGIGYKF